MIQIYTDGSCNPALGVGGWAALLFIAGEKIIVSGHQVDTTHQRMELTAAINALDYVIDHGLSSEPVRLYSDSQYVVDIARRKTWLELNRFQTRKQSAIRNEDLVRQLIRCSAMPDLQFIKVKAHLKKQEHDHEFNRVADQLSRKIVRDYVEKLSSL